MIGVLVSVNSSAVATQPIDAPEIRAAGQNAATRSDHEFIAKELLEQYENKSYLYRRQAQDLQSHTSALIRDCEKRVKSSMKVAALHRKMAARLHETHAATTQPLVSAAGL